MAHPRHERDLDDRTSSLENPYSDTGQPPAAPRAPRRRSRAVRVGAPLAALAVASAAVFGTLSATAGDDRAVADSSTSSFAGALGNVVDRRSEAVSRGAARTVDNPQTLADNPKKLQRAYDKSLRRTTTYEAVQQADSKLWTTADLNLWTLPGNKAKKVGLLAEEKKVLVTGRHRYGRDEVVVKGKSRWVSKGYLAREKPVEPQPVVADSGSSGGSSSGGGGGQQATSEAGSATGTCSNGTSLSSGVSPNLRAVHEAVCANFPEITNYGDFRGDGEHAQGIAVDIMVSGARGQQVADFVRANASSLGVNYVIYSQHIWSTARAGEGWRGMSDRGSTTANHYDHVHVTVN